MGLRAGREGWLGWRHRFFHQLSSYYCHWLHCLLTLIICLRCADYKSRTCQNCSVESRLCWSRVPCSEPRVGWTVIYLVMSADLHTSTMDFLGLSTYTMVYTRVPRWECTSPSSDHRNKSILPRNGNDHCPTEVRDIRHQSYSALASVSPIHRLCT